MHPILPKQFCNDDASYHDKLSKNTKTNGNAMTEKFCLFPFPFQMSQIIIPAGTLPQIPKGPEESCKSKSVVPNLVFSLCHSISDILSVLSNIALSYQVLFHFNLVLSSPFQPCPVFFSPGQPFLVLSIVLRPIRSFQSFPVLSSLYIDKCAQI